MRRKLLRLLVVVAPQTIPLSTATLFSISSSYLGDRCSGTPYTVYVQEDDNCTARDCSSSVSNSSDADTDMLHVECSSDFLPVVRSKFGNSPYIIEVVHSNEECTDVAMAYGYPASGTCEGAYDYNESYYVIANLNENGSASIEFFSDRPCLSDTVDYDEYADKETLASHSCDPYWYRWYSSNDQDSSSVSGSASIATTPSSGHVNPGAIVGIVVGSLVVTLAFIAAIVIRYRRRHDSEIQQQLKERLQSSSLATLEAAIRGQTGLWNDDVITAKRIPRDKVFVQELISRGSFGEVYRGLFNEQKVAVKMLLSAMSGNLHHVGEFLAEAKMTATMEHPNIVAFIGVAWDSLSDLCVVLEFMEGGELRTLLDQYLASNRKTGFDRQKATIALEVCHALTYLHSLTPPVLHRDLKSRNVLLNGDLEAKLSDFGISRERLDRTMTAGVGTSLWMAPEVMLGERYDDKADMFSFGVVLSELDVHTLPYTRVKQQTLDSNGHEITDSVLLQKVALGQAHVEFSDTNPRQIADLGRACLSMDPTERPSAAEALYQLQVILSSRKLR